MAERLDDDWLQKLTQIGEDNDDSELIRALAIALQEARATIATYEGIGHMIRNAGLISALEPLSPVERALLEGPE